MDSCQETQARITPYLDGESSEGERRTIEAHLRQCPSCRDEAAAQGVARRVLLARSSMLQAKAPAGLRERCAALAPARKSASRARGWSAWRVLSLGTATAMGVLAAVFVFGVATHSPILLAAEMTLDHLKCFALFESAESPQASAVEAAVRDRFGWTVRVPGSTPPQNLVLLGARRCLSHDGSVAHVMYRHEGRPVSLFMMPKAEYRTADVNLGGYPAHVWSKGEMTYVLVASEPMDRLQPVREYFAASLR